jgi:class 3 adenylate cyclase
MGASPSPPTGTITFLFTDIEGSTRLWEQHPEGMREALAGHDALLHQAIEQRRGHVFKTMGDAIYAAFPTPVEAVGAALDAQRVLREQAWGEIGLLRVRMALHTGPAQERAGDYFGPALNRVARLLTAGHGGQVLLTQVTAERLRSPMPGGAHLRLLGAHRLRDIADTETIYQLLAPGLPSDFPPLNTLDVAFHRGMRRATAVSGVILSVIAVLARRARAGERAARRERYAAQMSLADQAWKSGNFGRAVELLEAQRPAPGREDLRGFEWRYLWHRCRAGDHATLCGHTDATISLAFAPDGRTLATGSNDRTVKLWEIATRRELGLLLGHADHVHTVRFSPDGKLLAAGGSDTTVRVWEIASGQSIACLQGHEAAVWPVEFSPDGEILASGSYDTTLRLWDVGSQRVMAILAGHQGAVRGVAFSPDGRLLATGSFDQTIKLWDVGSHRELASLIGHKGPVRSVAFSPDGALLASCGGDDAIMLWDVATKETKATLRGHTAPVFSAAFSSDGKRLASASLDQTVRLWSIGARRELTTFRGHTGHVYEVAFSPGQSNACLRELGF